MHLSSPRAAAILRAAKASGTNITSETCLHYLLLTEEDLLRIGNIARCGPPLRAAPLPERLWGHLLDGDIDMIASDHCPYPVEQKASDLSVWNAGMGLTGIETNVPLLMGEGVLSRGMSLTQFARLTATAPAQRFGLVRKGRIRIGGDADLTLWDPAGESEIKGANFRGRSPFSAFEGWKKKGRLVRTLLRGVEIFIEGQDHGAPGGGQFHRRA